MAAKTKPKPAAPKTRAACERAMAKHRDGYKAYQIARVRARLPNAHIAAKAAKEQERHRAAYSAYKRAYTQLLRLRKEEA